MSLAARAAAVGRGTAIPVLITYEDRARRDPHGLPGPIWRQPGADPDDRRHWPAGNPHPRGPRQANSMHGKYPNDEVPFALQQLAQVLADVAANAHGPLVGSEPPKSGSATHRDDIASPEFAWRTKRTPQ